jgi:antitoxin (DNA-binding transcriptional repressor) of toxin-antitoxin stability system
VKSVNVHEAKTHFSKLLARVERGEEIVIARAGRPVAKLVRNVGEPGRRPFGLYKGLIKMSDDFDDPLPDEFWTSPVFPDEDDGDQAE